LLSGGFRTLKITRSNPGTRRYKSATKTLWLFQSIFAPLIIALPTTLGTIVIHGVAVIAIVHFVRHQRQLGRAVFDSGET
jgi:hypothetical protein